VFCVMYQLSHPGLAISNREDIITQFFDSDVLGAQVTAFDFECYLEYFEDQCQLVRQKEDLETSICTLQNLCSIIHQIKTGKDRATIKSSLTNILNNSRKELEDDLNNIIDLAARLYVMVYAVHMKGGVTGQTSIAWKEGSLRDTIANHFQHQRILTDSIKFEKVFNAKNIERIAAVAIQWTPNLVDHLRFIEDGKKPVLNIFHHAMFLRVHQKRYVKSSKNRFYVGKADSLQ
jgi:cysteinyl-tRNA synthetase